MHEKYIIKNPDINDYNYDNTIFTFHNVIYLDNINYFSYGLKMISLFGIHSDYLPYSICYMLVNENNKSINKLPPSLKMLCISTEMQIQLDKIYNFPLLIQYMHINHKSFIKYKYILAIYIKLTDIIIGGIIMSKIKLDSAKCYLIKYNLHIFTNKLFHKYVQLSLQN